MTLQQTPLSHEEVIQAGKDAAGVFHFPDVSPNAALWLMTERKAAGLAVDTLSLDHGASKDFKTHYL